MTIQDFITTTLNLKQDQIQNIHLIKSHNSLEIHITLVNKSYTCPRCGGKCKNKGFNNHPRHYQTLPFAGMSSSIVWYRRRFVCSDCGHSFSEENPFGPENFHQTYSLLNQLLIDLRRPENTYLSIARKYNLSVSTVQLYSDSFIHVPRLTLPENLGIDELSSRMSKYGGSYLCIFVDNDNRLLTEILPNRSKHSLSRYLETIPLAERKHVRFVTIDMWEPYRDVSLKYFPNCIVAVDPFHVVKNLCQCFNRLRIDLMNQAVYDSPAYYLLKQWHKLLDSDYNLDNEPKYNSFFRRKLNYRDLYNMLLALHPDLRLAYHLKEMYRDFNRNATEDDCEERLQHIYEAFCESNLYCYTDFIGLLEHWKPEILNSFKRPYENRKLSNALAENTNMRLRSLMTVSNGYSNFERFRARALFCLNNHVYYSLTSRLTTLKRQGKKRGSYNKQSYLLSDDPNNSIDTITDNFIEE